jgi:hypothetical protein
MHKVQITESQLESIAELADMFLREMQQFADDPPRKAMQLAALVGFELEIIETPIPDGAQVAEPLAGRMFDALATQAAYRATRAPSETQPDEMPGPLRKPTPQELKGYNELLQGRQGTVQRPAGAGSYFCILEDGSDVVLPGWALYLIGAAEPKQPIETHDAERVSGWEAVIAGRTGKHVREGAPGNYVVTFDDGQEVTLPEAALVYADCVPPTKA